MSEEENISIENIKQLLRDNERKYIPKEGEIIYHYCSADSFQKIIENRTLRLSDITAMNDSMELEWGISKILKVVKKFSAIKDCNTINHEELKEELYSVKNELLFLAACFSKKRDDLSQWRGYADDCKGFSIGISPKIIYDIFTKENKEHECFLEIIYNESKQRREIARIIRGLINKPHFNYKRVEELSIKLLKIISSYKNPAFKAEEEVRLITRYDKNSFKRIIKFQFKNGIPVPYIDFPIGFPFEKESIKEIWIGPKNPSSVEDIKFFLKMNEYKVFDEKTNKNGIKIEKSAASYR